MPYKSKRQLRKFFAMENRGELPKGTAKRWAHETKNISSLPEKATKKASDLTKEAAYLELFRTVSKSQAVQNVKTAGIGSFFKHPAVAYGLGLTALGAGLPLAYGLGKQKAIEDAQRVYGISPPAQIDPSVYYTSPDAGSYGQSDQLGFEPDYYGDAYGDPYGYGLDSLYDDSGYGY